MVFKQLSNAGFIVCPSYSVSVRGRYIANEVCTGLQLTRSSTVFCDVRQVEVQGTKTDSKLPMYTCFAHIRTAVFTETINGHHYCRFLGSNWDFICVTSRSSTNEL